jgi:DNA-directed RNA polymerase specialized sigma24 family protein
MVPQAPAAIFSFSQNQEICGIRRYRCRHISVMTASDFAALVESHGAGLVLIARQWCATPEDIVQDALLKLIVQSVPPGDPASWLYRVVRNGAIDAGRKERRQRKRELATLNGSPWLIGASRVPRQKVDRPRIVSPTVQRYPEILCSRSTGV